MSSRVIINTLKFCTKEKRILLYCLDCLGKKYVEQNNRIIVEDQTINCGNDVFYMNVDTRNVVGSQLFSLVNGKLAEIEKQLVFRKEEENKLLILKAQQENALYEARKLKKLINNTNHLIIESSHPSPLSAHNGFFGSKPFSKINTFLIDNKLEPIDWSK